MLVTSTIELPRWQDFARDVDESDAPELYDKIRFLYLPTLGRTGTPVSLREGRLVEVGSFSSVTYTGSEYGDVIVHNATGDFTSLSSDSGRDLPLDDSTYALLYRKTDGTDRASQVFGVMAGATERTMASIPFSDGVVYWTHATSSSRPTFAWTSDTDWHVWHFTVAPGGGATAGNIWLDGVNVGNGNSVTRTGSTADFRLGSLLGSHDAGDLAEYGGLIIFNEELSTEAIRMHAEDFYAPFRSSSSHQFRYGFVPTVAAPAGGDWRYRPQCKVVRRDPSSVHGYGE